MASTINSSTSNGIVITPDTSGEIELQANGVTKAKITANGLQDANGASLRGGMYRNRIINGDMFVNQRGGTVTVDNANNNYGIDRWHGRGTASDGVFTTVQDTESPTGFTNSAKITVTTADTSIGTSERYEYRQRIEGYNIVDLGWGTANAKTVTLSFWVRSSVTGTFGGSFTNQAGNRSYVFSYTISSANTWEKKIITIAGDTTGTWVTSNGIGIGLSFSLGHGSDYVQNAGSWYASYESAVTGQTNLIATNAATWYLTGVQLEVGSGASDFEFLPYDVQLARCKRYYQIVYPTGGGIGAYGTVCDFTYQYPVEMRASPTAAQSSVVATITDVVGADFSQSSQSFTSMNGPTKDGHHIRVNNFSGLTNYRIYLWRNVDTGAYITYSAEL